MEHTEEPELSELAQKLQNRKKKRNYHGLYDFVVIDLTYASSRMVSCRLSRSQVDAIFRKGKVRVGRLIMFMECLRHGAMPFIIDDKRRSRYLRGIKEWHDDRYEMIDVVMEAQERFASQIELQRLHAAGQFFASATYQEGFDDENE